MRTRPLPPRKSLGTARPIPGFPGYTVDEEGVVYSKGGRSMKSNLRTHGRYPSVQLYKDGRYFRVKVHSAVMLAFVGPRPEGKEVLHRDGDRENVRRSNLRYGTHAENGADMVRHGRAKGNPKLTGDQVREARQRFAEGGISQSALGRELGGRWGVNERTIRRALTAETYMELS